MTLAVAAVLAAVAIPNMGEFIRNNRLTSGANDLLRSIQVARSEAIKRQANVVVCASDDPTEEVPECSGGDFNGWIVFQDTNASWAFDEGEPIVERHNVLHESVTVRTDQDGILSFAASGFANPAGAAVPSTRVVICDDRGNSQFGDNSRARALLIEPTGRARVTKSYTDVADAISTAGTCP